MATAAEIRNKAAKKLGILAAGQTLRSDRSTDLDEAYAEVYDMLQELNLVSWYSTGSVPDAVVKPVVALVAEARATEYSISQERYNRIKIEAGAAEIEIRRIVVDPYFRDNNDAVYY